jgi:hypothetical protein
LICSPRLEPDPADLAGVLAAGVYELIDGHLDQCRRLLRPQLLDHRSRKRPATKSAMLARPIRESPSLTSRRLFGLLILD